MWRIAVPAIACASVNALAGNHSCISQPGEACGLSDADPLLQQSVKRSPWLDVYMSTAETLEDIMYWAVLYKSMKPYFHAHPHWLLIRKGSDLHKRAHAIRIAMGQNFWHTKLDVFEPEVLNLIGDTDIGTFRQLGAFMYTPDEYRRVVQIDSDSLVFKNIDHMTHRIPHMILARDQGDCRNLTHTLLSQQPATNLMSMVPDTRVVNLLTTATVRLYASNDSRRVNVSHANLISRAFSRVHPDLEQGSFGNTEVVSATCLMHHRDQVLRNRKVLDDMHVLHLGHDGRRLINDIILHGEKRLISTLDGLKQAGKTGLSDSLRSWFECFASAQVKSIVEAAKNGPLGEK